MGYNYTYELNKNPKLTSLGEIKFEPITEEHTDRVKREIKKFRVTRRKGVVQSVIFFIIGLIFVTAAVLLWINFKNLRALAFLPMLISFFFLVLQSPISYAVCSYLYIPLRKEL